MWWRCGNRGIVVELCGCGCGWVMVVLLMGHNGCCDNGFDGLCSWLGWWWWLWWK